jgi:hypothetical protein
LTAFALALFCFPLSFAAAAPLPKQPIREQVQAAGGEFVINYHPTANEKDLGMPFYPKAAVSRSYLHRVTRGGKQVSLFARARLLSRDGLAAITRFYQKKLPGHPRAERKQTPQGKVVTLVAGASSDLRLVKITAGDKGKPRQILLTRAVRPPRTEKPEEKDSSSTKGQRPQPQQGTPPPRPESAPRPQPQPGGVPAAQPQE